jgi:uncharacterized protein YkwD
VNNRHAARTMGRMHVRNFPERSTSTPHTTAEALVAALVAVLVAAVALVATAAPADAAKRTPVSIAAPASVSLPAAATVSGSVGGKSQGATVTLLQRRSGDWQAVQRTTVSAARTYVFTVSVSPGVNEFQVKAKKSKRLKRAGASATVVVVGDSGPVSADVTAARARILQDTNAYRAQHGRRALQAMPLLDVIAQTWTQVMATTGILRHNLGFFGQYPGDPSAGGENIAVGYTPETVVGGWIASPDHRANLLGSYTHIGIGYVRSASGRAYFTQNFAAY